MFHWKGEILILHVHVQPRASRDELSGTHGARLRVRITAPPVDGKANDHLLRFLAGVFGVSRRKVTLLSGQNSRDKRIQIENPAHLPDCVQQGRSQPG